VRPLWFIASFQSRAGLPGDNTARDLLSKVCARVPSGPVVILSEQIATGTASEDELGLAGAPDRARRF